MFQSKVFRDNPTLPALCQHKRDLRRGPRPDPGPGPSEFNKLTICVAGPTLSETLSLYLH